MKNSDAFARTKIELCQALEISRPTLDRYTVLPGFPEKADDGWPLDACRAFVSGQLHRREEYSRLELEKMRQEVSQAQMRTLREAERLMPREWSELLFAHLAVSARNVIQGADIPEEIKADMTAKIEALDASEFLAQLKLEGIPEA
jgi:hypothetical protein